MSNRHLSPSTPGCASSASSARRFAAGCALVAARLFAVLALVGVLPARAQQQSWTLEQCIDHALKHNITLRQAGNRWRQQQLQLQSSRMQRLPDLSASAGENLSFGRGLTADNTYTNTNTSSTSFSLGTSIPLLTGNRLPKTVELNRLNLEAATQDLERARNDVRVQVAQQYVQVLYDLEIADVACSQVAIDSAQLARMEALFEVGRTSEADVAQQRSALAQSRLTAAQADGNTRLALLALSQLLELPSAEGFSISRSVERGDSWSVEGGVRSENSLEGAPDAIFAEAVAQRPEVQAEQLRLKGTNASIAIARSGYYPTLSFSAGLGSSYYKTSGYPSASFGEQLKNNFSQYLGLNLNIPIFDRFATRNSIRSAKIDRENQLLALENTKKQLYKEIQTACANTQTARQRLHSSEQALASSREAFRLVQAKYEVGKATPTEFAQSRGNLLKAESDLVQARYEYLYQTALIRFYRGQPLGF